MKSPIHAVGVAVTLLASGSVTWACPVCGSETGRQVQAGIFNAQFWPNVFMTLLPFPVLLVIVALIFFDLTIPWKKSPKRHDPLADLKGDSTWPMR